MPRVLVVGGGIAGTCTAIALGRRGFAPELVEARPRPPTEGAAIVLHGNGVRALRQLGLGPALDKAAAAVSRWDFRDQDCGLLCSTDLGALWTGVGPCLALTRTRLMQILGDAATGLQRRFGCAVTGVRQTDDDVRVSFGDGSTQEYDLVVGADGIRSTIRRLAVSRPRRAAPPRSGGAASSPARYLAWSISTCCSARAASSGSPRSATAAPTASPERPVRSTAGKIR